MIHSTSTKRILLVADTIDQLIHLERFSEYFEKNLYYVVAPRAVLTAADNSKGLSDSIQYSFFSYGWRLKHNKQEKVFKEKSKFKKKEYKPRSFIGSLAQTSFFEICEALFLILKNLVLACLAWRFLESRKIGLVVCCGDRYGTGWVTAFLVGAKKTKIASLMPAFAVISNGIAIRASRNDYRITGGSIFKRSVTSMFRTHRVISDAKGLSFYRAPELIAKKLTGSLSPNPWCIGAGLLSTVCVDSYASRDSLLFEGINSEKIRVTGDISSDRLFDNVSMSELTKKDSLSQFDDCRRELCILAVPQLAEHHLVSWDTHWESLKKIIETILDSKRFNLLLSLHPKSNFKDYEFLEENKNIRISRRPLVEVISSADFFLSAFSSTVNWAILSNVPSICIDYWGLFSKDTFPDIESIIYVKSTAELASALKLSRKDKTLAKLERDRIKLTDNLLFDGKSRSRYANVINELYSGCN